MRCDSCCKCLLTSALRCCVLCLGSSKHWWAVWPRRVISSSRSRMARLLQLGCVCLLPLQRDLWQTPSVLYRAWQLWRQVTLCFLWVREGGCGFVACVRKAEKLGLRFWSITPPLFIVNCSPQEDDLTLWIVDVVWNMSTTEPQFLSLFRCFITRSSVQLNCLRFYSSQRFLEPKIVA